MGKASITVTDTQLIRVENGALELRYLVSVEVRPALDTAAPVQWRYQVDLDAQGSTKPKASLVRAQQLVALADCGPTWATQWVHGTSHNPTNRSDLPGVSAALRLVAQGVEHMRAQGTPVIDLVVRAARNARDLADAELVEAARYVGRDLPSCPPTPDATAREAAYIDGQLGAALAKRQKAQAAYRRALDNLYTLTGRG